MIIKCPEMTGSDVIKVCNVWAQEKKLYE
jgi:hypothetical protein